MPRESTLHPHVAEELAYLFNAENGGATEEEYLAFLAALVRCLKPRRVLETGTWTGAGTIALATAMHANGFGELVAVDTEQEALAKAEARISAARLDVEVAYVAQNSMEYLAGETAPFGFVFLDSHLPTRAKELALILDRGLLAPGGVAAIHDTSRLRTTVKGVPDPESAEFWSIFDRKVRRAHQPKAVLELPLSRGLTVVQI